MEGFRAIGYRNRNAEYKRILMVDDAFICLLVCPFLIEHHCILRYCDWHPGRYVKRPIRHGGFIGLSKGNRNRSEYYTVGAWSRFNNIGLEFKRSGVNFFEAARCNLLERGANAVQTLSDFQKQ